MKVPPNHCIRPSESRDGILWPVRRSRPRGITLIELMIAVGIVTAVVGVMGFLSLGTWRTFLISRSYMDVEGLARLAMDWMVRDIRAATQIYDTSDPSVTIDGSTYSTSSDELVLWKRSDEEYEDFYVFIVYHLVTASYLYRIVDGPDPVDGSYGSADADKLITPYVSTLNFEDGEDPGTDPDSDTDLVGLSLTVSKTRFGKERNKTLTSAVRLRNR